MIRCQSKWCMITVKSVCSSSLKQQALKLWKKNDDDFVSEAVQIEFQSEEKNWPPTVRLTKYRLTKLFSTIFSIKLISRDDAFIKRYIHTKKTIWIWHPYLILFAFFSSFNPMNVASPISLHSSSSFLVFMLGRISWKKICHIIHLKIACLQLWQFCVLVKKSCLSSSSSSQPSLFVSSLSFCCFDNIPVCNCESIQPQNH